MVYFILFFSFLATLQYMDLLGQGSDLSHSCNIRCSCSKAGSFPTMPGQGFNLHCRAPKCCQSHGTIAGTLAYSFLMIFPKNQLLAMLKFLFFFFFSVSVLLIFALNFIIFFFLLLLGLICFYFPRFLR